MATTIGILAYGSLIDDPGEEIESRTIDKTPGITTPFHVEFARSSRKRGGGPTLVPVEIGGAQVKAIIYRLDTTEGDAADMLYRREIGEVGGDRRYQPPAAGRRNAVRIDRIDDLAGHGPTLYARLGANIDPLTSDRLADLAIESTRRVSLGADGISYLLNAKTAGIVTSLSAAYERAILDRLGAPDLEHALDRLKSQP